MVFVVGAFLCMLSSRLASPHSMSAALPSVVTTKNESRHCQMSPESRITPIEKHHPRYYLYTSGDSSPKLRTDCSNYELLLKFNLSLNCHLFPAACGTGSFLGAIREHVQSLLLMMVLKRFQDSTMLCSPSPSIICSHVFFLPS